MAAKAISKGYSIIRADVISALPHAYEGCGTYMRAPREWIEYPVVNPKGFKSWKLLKFLYGRRPVGHMWYRHLKWVLTVKHDLDIKGSEIEPGFPLRQVGHFPWPFTLTTVTATADDDALDGRLAVQLQLGRARARGCLGRVPEFPVLRDGVRRAARMPPSPPAAVRCSPSVRGVLLSTPTRPETGKLAP